MEIQNAPSSEKETEEMLSEVFFYLTGYLLQGSINPNFNINLNVFGAEALRFDTALKIRFLLDPKVLKYLQNLETLLRRIRTEVSRERQSTKGEVRGHIDWRQTIQKWAQSDFRDRTNYTISRPIKNYDIPENLVLKKTVSTLHMLMVNDSVKQEIDRDYSWSLILRESRKNLRTILRNVHFKKIMDENQIHVSSRMKNIVRQSRKKLYRDSCSIYEKYEHIFEKKSFNRTEFEDLLTKTFIDPRNVERLFELYCLFKILDILKEMGWKIQKISEITQNREETAILQSNNRTITVFYNVTDPANLFFIDLLEPAEIKEAQQRIARAYFEKTLLDTSRRPDIILEIVHNGKRNYLVFEIKYSRRSETIERGIYQALHYLYDISVVKGEPFFEYTLGNGYNAAVIAYRFPENIKKDNNVKNSKLKVKLFESLDLKNTADIKQFLGKFIASVN